MPQAAQVHGVNWLGLEPMVVHQGAILNMTSKMVVYWETRIQKSF